MNKKKDYIWNSIAGMINAAEAVIMSMVVTRYGLLSDAGILSLAFATGNVLMMIGKFGGRMFQVTDLKQQFSFKEYLVHRLIAVFLMFVVLVSLLLFKGYSTEKSGAIILIVVIYGIEAIEECIWGYFQSRDYLYVGAQMFTTRWVAVLIAFIGDMIINHSLLHALTCGAVVSTAVFLLWLIIIKIRGKKWGSISWKSEGKIVKKLASLFYQTIPLFISGFCAILISNIPKFAIDNYLNDEVQACYGFVAMPVFVIGLLNQFIYQPTVLKLTNEYNAGKIGEFRRQVRKQLIIVTGISLICVVSAGLIGIPVLSIIYKTDLSGYRKELVILQFAGAFLATSGYFQILLTLMRKQKIILVGYIVTSICGFILIRLLVKEYGTVGASIGYLILMFFLALFYGILYQLVLKKQSKR